jgi:hypothetical protein
VVGRHVNASARSGDGDRSVERRGTGTGGCRRMGPYWNAGWDWIAEERAARPPGLAHGSSADAGGLHPAE